MSFLDASPILGEDTDLDKGEQAYEDEEQSNGAVAEADTSQTGDAVAAFTEHMEVAGKSNEELEVALVHVSAVSAYFLKMHTKLLETNAAVAVELQRVGAVAHAARRVVEQSKEARRRRKHIALPQQDQDLGWMRGHEAKQETEVHIRQMRNSVQWQLVCWRLRWGAFQPLRLRILPSPMMRGLTGAPSS